MCDSPELGRLTGRSTKCPKHLEESFVQQTSSFFSGLILDIHFKTINFIENHLKIDFGEKTVDLVTFTLNVNDVCKSFLSLLKHRAQQEGHCPWSVHRVLGRPCFPPSVFPLPSERYHTSNWQVHCV